MAEPTQDPRDRKAIHFYVPFDTPPEKPIEVTAFAFDRRGNLLDRSPVREGQARLQLDDKQARTARLFFASLPENEKEPSLASMERLHAYEPAWRYHPQQREYKLLPIPESLWKWWFWCRCRVRGQVVKPVTIDGVTYNRPVCNARVHICEVDRLWWVLPRLPDDIIWRLRDELLVELAKPWPPIPEPDPPPFSYDPGVIDPSPENLARLARSGQRVSITAAAEADAPEIGVARQAAAVERRSPEACAQLGEISAASRAALASSSITLVRQALVDNVVLLRPWICRWRWLWPYICTCDEQAVLITDHQGRFETDIWYPCLGDRPDLYFWVEYSIGGSWTTVLRPPICCNTRWNYACGSEVTLRVTDPRVPWCDDDPPLPGKQVAVLSIGNNVSMTEIQRASAGADEGLTTAGQPFGGSLEPHVWFGDGLIGSGITHYRWSYRRAGSAGDWNAMDHDVVRHYAEVLADSTLTFKPFPLGPDPAFGGQNLFQIRPDSPPLNAGVVSSSWAPEVDGRSNTASAYLRSHLLEGGDPLAAAASTNSSSSCSRATAAWSTGPTRGCCSKYQR